MAVKVMAHPSVADRAAHGADARIQTPPELHTGWLPAEDRPDPVTQLEEQNVDQGTRPGAGPARPDDGLPVHVLPRRGEDHGHRPRRHPDRRADHPVVRGRAPVQLRVVRLPGTRPGLRPQRLRRDPARPVRIRRQADGGQLHHRRPVQRPDHGPSGVRHPSVGAGLPGGDGPVRADAHHGHLVCPHVLHRPAGHDQQTRHRPQRRSKAGKSGKKGKKAAKHAKAGREGARERCVVRPARREEPAEGADPGQPAGAVQARRDRRRALPDRQPTPDRGAVAGHRNDVPA